MPMIHNRGRQIGEKFLPRKIVFPQSWDENGQPVKKGKSVVSETLLPGQHKRVTDEQLAHLKDLFPNEIVNIDDMRELQAQFPESQQEKTREGYLAPDEVEKRVQERVNEELAKRQKDRDEESLKKADLAQIDGMDRIDLIALIEKEGLDIDVKKYKAPAALKAAVTIALQNKAASESDDAA